MKTRSVLRLIVVLAVGALLFSCTAQGGSIYAIIETAQKTYVSTLDETITVLDILTTADPQFPYLVAAGAVFKGTNPDANNNVGWPNVGGTPVPVRPPVSGALCTALTFFSAAVYGGFFTSSGSTMGLYRSVGGPGYSFAVADGATAVPAMAGKQITFLQVVGGAGGPYLCASVATPVASGTSGFTYELDFSSDGTNFVTSLTGLTTPVTGVGFINGNYFVTAGSNLYSGGVLTGLSASTVPGFPPASGEVLNGVTTDSGHIFIPSSNGVVYYSNDGVAWSRAVTNDQINSRSIIFLTVSTHVDISGTGVTYIVGADGAGFYFLNLSNNTLSRFSDVTVTGLYSGAVRRVLVDPNPANNNTVFLGTAGTGLWRTTFDPATGLVPAAWIHE